MLLLGCCGCCFTFNKQECSTHKRSAMLALLGLLLAGAEPSSQPLTARLRTLTTTHLSAPCAPFALTTCTPSVPHARTAGLTSSLAPLRSGVCSACASPIFVRQRRQIRLEAGGSRGGRPGCKRSYAVMASSDAAASKWRRGRADG